MAVNAWWLLPIALVGIATNSVSAAHTFTKFAMHKAIFLSLFLDSLCSLLCSVMSSAVLVAMLTRDFEASSNIILCILLYNAEYFPSSLGLALTALVAVFRYTSLTAAARNNDEHNEVSSHLALKLVVCGMICYQITSVSIHYALGHPSSVIEMACYDDDEDAWYANATMAKVTMVTVSGPVLVCPAISVVFDLMILHKISFAVADISR